MSSISIDYGKEPIGKLFGKLFFPTVAGMMFSVLLIITDGIFVGHGLGSDALAAGEIITCVITVIIALCSPSIRQGKSAKQNLP